MSVSISYRLVFCCVWYISRCQPLGKVCLSRLYRNIATNLHQCLRLRSCRSVFLFDQGRSYTCTHRAECFGVSGWETIRKSRLTSLIHCFVLANAAPSLAGSATAALSFCLNSSAREVGPTLNGMFTNSSRKILHSMALRWIPVEQLCCFKGLVRIIFHLWSWRGGDSQLLAWGMLLQMLSFHDTPDESYPVHVMLSEGFLPAK